MIDLVINTFVVLAFLPGTLWLKKNNLSIYKAIDNSSQRPLPDHFTIILIHLICSIYFLHYYQILIPFLVFFLALRICKNLGEIKQTIKQKVKNWILEDDLEDREI